MLRSVVFRRFVVVAKQIQAVPDALIKTLNFYCRRLGRIVDTNLEDVY
jgi:hypothetical protein